MTEFRGREKHCNYFTKTKRKELKVPIVLNSPHMLQALQTRISSESQGSLLTVTSCKIRKSITYFKNTMAQNIYNHFKIGWSREQKVRKYHTKPRQKPLRIHVSNFVVPCPVSEASVKGWASPLQLATSNINISLDVLLLLCAALFLAVSWL